MLVHKDEKSPAAVYDLCTGLDLEGLPLGPGQFVGDDPHVVRALPLPFPVDLHSLLAVDNLVVQHPWKLELVALGRVCVQDHFAILQQLAAQGLPLNLPDGAGPGGTLHGDLGLQFAKNQGLGAAALNDARPLLPHHDAIFGLDQVFELHILRYPNTISFSFFSTYSCLSLQIFFSMSSMALRLISRRTWILLWGTLCNLRRI